MDRYPGSYEDEEVKKNPEQELEEDDEDDAEESNDKASDQRKKSFLETWLSRSSANKERDLLASSIGVEQDSNENKQSKWRRIGLFLGSIGRDNENNVEEGVREEGALSEDQLYLLHSEEGAEDVGEASSTVAEELNDAKQVVTERQDNKESEPDELVDNEVTLTDESGEDSEIVGQTTLEDALNSDNENEQQKQVVNEVETLDMHEVATDTGGFSEINYTERPTEVHEHNEYIEMRGGLSLADVLIYRSASNKIRAQGKKIEALRLKTEMQAEEIASLAERTNKAEKKASEAQNKQNIAETPPVEQLLHKYEATSDRKGGIRLDPEKMHDTDDFDSNTLRKNGTEKPKTAQQVESLEIVNAKEEPRELRYEQSHESKQFTATALSDALNESEAKKLLEKAQAGRSSSQPVSKPTEQSTSGFGSSSAQQSENNYHQAAVAGVLAAVFLMVIVFLLFSLF